MRTHWLWTLWLRKWKSWLFVGPWRPPWITHQRLPETCQDLALATCGEACEWVHSVRQLHEVFRGGAENEASLVA